MDQGKKVDAQASSDYNIFSRVHLFRCFVWFLPLFDQHLHSLLTCNFLIANKHMGEAGQATDDN